MQQVCKTTAYNRKKWHMLLSIEMIQIA